MSEARSKNQAALQTLGLAPELVDRLDGVRVGVYSEQPSNTAAGRLLAEALGDLLGRLWPNIDATGPLADLIISVAGSAASSGGLHCNLRTSWSPPYDYVISIGCDASAGSGPTRRVGADGWTFSVGPSAVVSDSPNPIGPGAVAALIAADLLKSTLASELGDRAQPIPDQFSWSMFDYKQGGTNPDPRPIDVGNAAIFGVGAVTHALAWFIARWPAPISGDIDLCDKDRYGESNAQRYVGMRRDFLDQPKVDRVRDLLGKHDSLRTTPHELDMNAYFDAIRPDCALPLAIAGLDSAEHRRQLAMKLPRRVINIWTESERLGASRYGCDDGWACLYCAYPRDESGAPDEVAQLQAETNLPPVRVRHLLNSSDLLSDADAAVIGAHLGTDAIKYVGQPLRSVRAQLCAIGRIPVQTSSAPVDVPLAFGSFLAGLGGFVELIKECSGDQSHSRWQFNSLRVPYPENYWPMAPTTACYLCADPLTKSVMGDKYRHYSFSFKSLTS